MLGISDPSSLAEGTPPATAGRGHWEQQGRHGVLLHTVLAVTAEGLPGGLSAQQWSARDPAQPGQHLTRRQRPTAASEPEMAQRGRRGHRRRAAWAAPATASPAWR
ncbi:MAG: hypothetical protein IT204_02480 [Fimbriimonadaceae bacterium]|nr:hypothetical protein [Fimbriimonadaceae bacterium]